MFGCQLLVDDGVIASVVDAPEVLSRFQYLAARAHVEGNRRIRWCPGPGCENAIRCAVAGVRTVKCSCGYELCFGCGEQAHEPISCSMIAAWHLRSRSDAETSNWIMANTKDW